jgi:hypothetical protein
LELEDLAASGDLTSAPELFERFKSEVEQVLPVLQRFVDTGEISSFLPVRTAMRVFACPGYATFENRLLTRSYMAFVCVQRDRAQATLNEAAPVVSES